MVRILILYYLNIKTTHGYEIQKFIQETGLEQWTQIKSGSRFIMAFLHFYMITIAQPIWSL